jgi:glycerate-2-kinase
VRFSTNGGIGGCGMIKTVRELRKALEAFDDSDLVIVMSGGGAQAVQEFPIDAIGQDLNSVDPTIILHLGLEYIDIMDI